MRWQSGRASHNVEDRRGSRVRKAGGLGLFGVVAVYVISHFTGIDPRVLMGAAQGVSRMSADQSPPSASTGRDDEMKRFVAVVLGDTEDTWHEVFRQERERTRGDYREPKLVLFDGKTPSACGMGDAAMGPFYCPADQKVYLDLSFFRDLAGRHGASGDFAQAYVIGHEVGHHVQTLLGTSTRVHRQKQKLSKTAGNALSVRLELQADCYAGLWAHHADKARKILESGDIEEALTAAAAIGDDRLQSRSGRTVVPESFTHGSSQQRMHWFTQGLKVGTLAACDTFAASARDI